MTKSMSETDWRSPGASTFMLLIVVVLAGGLTDPLPLWPANWGDAPSIGATAIVVALINALISFSRRDGWDSQ
ncbi:hypothetical protein [Brevundimonas sp.]|uniref:hypothetical protein n=1 Tax=Brevundimonas sp. TaxID=1871086 RepID=UPI003F6EA04C